MVMKYNPAKHHRRSIRLKGYDYSQAGAYFITIVTQGRACLFGDVVGGEMRLSTWGAIAREEWFRTAKIRPYVRLHDAEFVVMPNHVHGIIWIVDDDDDVVGARRRRAPTGRRAPLSDHDVTVERFGAPVCGSIPTIVRAFKSATTKRVNALRNTPGAPVWQRNYYEHIIRNEESLNRIRDYIANNPLQWEWDRENPTV
jgi:putative transposase